MIREAFFPAALSWGANTLISFITSLTWKQRGVPPPGEPSKIAYRVGSPDSSVEGEDPMEIGEAPEVHVRMSIISAYFVLWWFILYWFFLEVQLPLSIRNWVGAADKRAAWMWNLKVSVNSDQRVQVDSLWSNGSNILWVLNKALM